MNTPEQQRLSQLEMIYGAHTSQMDLQFNRFYHQEGFHKHYAPVQEPRQALFVSTAENTFGSDKNGGADQSHDRPIVQKQMLKDNQECYLDAEMHQAKSKQEPRTNALT